MNQKKYVLISEELKSKYEQKPVSEVNKYLLPTPSAKVKKIRRRLEEEPETSTPLAPKKFYFRSGQLLPPYINFKMSGRLFPKKTVAEKRARDEVDSNTQEPPAKRIATWNDEPGTSWEPVQFYGTSPETKTDEESVDESHPKKHRRKTASNKTKVGERTPHDSRGAVQPSTTKKSKSKSKSNLKEGFSWADSTELSLLMCFKEDVGIKDRDPDVFRKHPNLTPRMRAILLDWLMEVCEVYKMRRITYYLAVDYIDRYLSRIDVLPKHQLQLLGITCLFIASKVEEIYPPKLLELAYVTDGACTDQEMLLKEMAILKELRWNVLPQTVSTWLYLFLQMACSRETTRDTFKRELIDDEFIFPQMSTYAFMRASQLIDLCSLDDGMLQFQYSVIAAGAIYYLSNRETALYVSGLTWNKIRDCVCWMGPFAEIIRRNCLNTPFPSPKEYPRLGSGLKRVNPRIILDEAHTIQTHAVDLAMLEAVYSLANEQSQEYATPGFDNAANLIDNPEIATNAAYDYNYSEKSPVGASSELHIGVSPSSVSSVKESSNIDDIFENETKSHIKLKAVVDEAKKHRDNYPLNIVQKEDDVAATSTANAESTASSHSSNRLIVDEDYDDVELRPVSSTAETNCQSSARKTSATAPENNTVIDPFPNERFLDESTDSGSENNGSDFSDSSVEITLSDLDEESESEVVLVSPSDAVAFEGRIYHRDAPNVRNMFPSPPSPQVAKPAGAFATYKDSNDASNQSDQSDFSDEIDTNQQDNLNDESEGTQPDLQDLTEDPDPNEHNSSIDSGSVDSQSDSSDETVPNQQVSSNDNESEDTQPELVDPAENTSPSEDAQSNLSDSSDETVPNQQNNSSDNDSDDDQTVQSDSSDETKSEKPKFYRILSRDVRMTIKTTKEVIRDDGTHIIDGEDSDSNDATYSSRVSTVSKYSTENTISKIENYNVTSCNRNPSSRRVSVYKVIKRKIIEIKEIVMKQRVVPSNNNNNERNGSKPDQTFVNSSVPSPNIRLSTTSRDMANDIFGNDTSSIFPEDSDYDLDIVNMTKPNKLGASQKPMGIKKTRWSRKIRCVIETDNPLKIKIIADKRSPITNNSESPLRNKSRPSAKFKFESTHSNKRPVVDSKRRNVRKSQRLKNKLNYTEPNSDDSE